MHDSLTPTCSPGACCVLLSYWVQIFIHFVQILQLNATYLSKNIVLLLHVWFRPVVDESLSYFQVFLVKLLVEKQKFCSWMKRNDKLRWQAAGHRACALFTRTTVGVRGPWQLTGVNTRSQLTPVSSRRRRPPLRFTTSLDFRKGSGFLCSVVKRQMLQNTDSMQLHVRALTDSFRFLRFILLAEFNIAISRICSAASQLN